MKLAERPCRGRGCTVGPNRNMLTDRALQLKSLQNLLTFPRNCDVLRALNLFFPLYICQLFAARTLVRVVRTVARNL